MRDDPVPRLTRREAALALAAGVLLAAGLAWTGRTPAEGLGWRVAFVGLHVAGCAGLWAGLRRRAPTVRQLLVGAVIFRVCALPMAPALSDDGYRYLWDGRLTVETDVSPYEVRPSDPSLETWHDGVLYERMNSRDYYSVYPPASQVVFAVAAAVYEPLGWRASWTLLKILLVAAEFVGIVALLRLVGARGAALYAWSPLAVVEVAGQGHTEALVVAGLGLVLMGGARSLGSLGATVAGLAKLYPLALLPFTWRREGRSGLAVSLSATILLGALVWSPNALEHVSESVGLFFGTFDEYAAPYRILKAALFPLAGEAAGRLASLALAGLFAVLLLGTWLADDGTRQGLTRAVAVVVLGFVLTASTLHPWYWLPVLWMCPLLQRKNPSYWISSTASTSYLSYVFPPAALIATLVGWGGALLLALWPRGDRL